MGLAPTDFSDPGAVRRHKVSLVRQLRDAGVKQDANGKGLGNLPVQALERLAEQHLDTGRTVLEEELHGYEPPVDDGMDALFDRMFATPEATEAEPLPSQTTPVEKSPGKEVVVETEAVVEEEKTVLSFEKAKEILGAKIVKFQGQVSAIDFEEALEFLVKLGSRDLAKALDKEKDEIARINKPKSILGMDGSELKAKLKEASQHVKESGQHSAEVSKALARQGFSSDTLDTLAEVVEPAAELIEQASEFTPVADSVARVFFFLKANAPEEMPDGTVFEEVVKPLLENIASRANEKSDLKYPTKQEIGKRDKPAAVKRKKAYNAKLSRLRRQFQEKLVKAVPQFYQLILEQFADHEPALVKSRLENLS